MEKQDIFYGLDGQEELTETDIDEAIERILDDMHPFPIPKTITVCKFSREKVEEISSSDMDWILEAWIEKLDERYAGPNCNEQKPADVLKMCEAIDECFQKICSIYVPWTCEKVSEEIIETRPWIEKNAPNWIEEGIKFQE